jgi:hypothetical protein
MGFLLTPFPTPSMECVCGLAVICEKGWCHNWEGKRDGAVALAMFHVCVEEGRKYFLFSITNKISCCFVTLGSKLYHTSYYYYVQFTFCENPAVAHVWALKGFLLNFVTAI